MDTREASPRGCPRWPQSSAQGSFAGCIGRANSQALERGCSDTLHPQECALRPDSPGTLHIGQKVQGRRLSGSCLFLKEQSAPDPLHRCLSRDMQGEGRIPVAFKALPWGKDASLPLAGGLKQQRFPSTDICLFPKFTRPRVDQPQCGSYSGFKYAQHKHCIQCRSTPWVRGEN